VALAAPAIPGSEPAPDSAGGVEERDFTLKESGQAIELLFSGQTGTAMVLMDSLEAECGQSPLFYLTRARLHREFLPVDDEQKEGIAESAAPLYADLDACIAACTERIEAGDDDARLYLYRGWAWMFKSHVRTYARSMWTAGKEAKKGKKDLEHYLELYPNDPIANSIMGAFLYFADTLPAAYRFVSKLLFLPGGDRDRGLQMMELAVGWDSLIEMDNRLVLYSVYIGFEGRYEEGVEGFEYLHRTYPDHSTFMRPKGVMMPLKPGYTRSDRDSLDTVIERYATFSPEQQERATYWLLRFARAYSDRFYDPENAIDGFESIIQGNPEHPDWIRGFAAFEMGRLQAALGDAEEAKRAFLIVTNDPRAKGIHGEANDMLGAMKDWDGQSTLPPLELILPLYNGDPSTAEGAAKYLAAIEEPTAAELFYLGEAYLAAGNNSAAVAAYVRSLGSDAPRWDESYRLIAGTRAGELTGAAGSYEAAAEYFRRARELWHREFLYDWLLDGRQRYFERLDRGEALPPYRWFAAR
jgi:tetratricopeptide (TPR) repeat protein